MENDGQTVGFPQFSKPKNGQKTRHLFVGNCGPNLGVDEETVREIFGEYGEVEIFMPGREKSHVFVSYDTVENAERAVDALKGAKCELAGGRVLVIKYADIPTPPQPQPEEIPVCETSEECGVPGLIFIPNFITEEEEKSLLCALEYCTEGWELHAGRRVKHFGVRFDYSTRNVDREHPLDDFPDPVKIAAAKIEELEGIPTLDQLTVNDYPPGVGLAPHIDTHSAFTGPIISLSLNSPGIMEFRKEGERRRILLTPRSLLVMDGASRYSWQHYIPHKRRPDVTSNRISLTFRQARGFPCDCEYSEYCDSQDGAQPPTRLALGQQGGQSTSSSQLNEQLNELNGDLNGDGDRGGACSSAGGEVQTQCTGSGGDGGLQKLEDDYVHKVYDVIARHFSATRFAIWPKVREFLEALPQNGMLVDVGCGNGKYFTVRKDLVVTGLDRSKGLVEVALARVYPEGLPTVNRPVVDVGVADGLKLPLRCSIYNGALCIAVLHHVSSVARRLQILEEILRVLIPGGRALITVWAQEQEDPKKTLNKWKPIERPEGGVASQVDSGETGGDYFVPWHLPLHRVEGQKAAEVARQSEEGSGSPSSTSNALNDNLGEVNQQKKTVVFQRYYHLFVKGELEALCGQLGNAKVVDSFYDKSNWCIVLEKCRG